MMARERKAPIPLTLVAGPRGAGKTTLINRLITAPEFADMAVILNDFGRTGVQGGAMRAEGGYIALGSGCVCCAVRGALVDGLEGLLRDLDNRRVARIGRVIVEADEAADPSAILAAVERHPYLSLRYTAEGITTVLDPGTLSDVLDRRAETVRQVAMADWIVFSRQPDEVARAQVSALNRRAALLQFADLEQGRLAQPLAPEAEIDPDAWLGLPARSGSAALTGEAGRIHIFGAVRRGMMSFAALDRFVEYLAYLQAPNLLRVRGIVSTGEAEATLVDGIGGLFRPLQVIDREGPPAIQFSVIARDLTSEVFDGYIDAFIGEVHLDGKGMPAEGNPLAIAGFSARSGR